MTSSSSSKKRAFALMFIVLLSIIVVTPIAFTNRANANFCFPPDNPDITFHSPVNTTYTMNNVSLNVTIHTYRTGWSGAAEDASYRHLEYSIDGKKYSMPIKNAVIGPNPGCDVIFDCLISLHQLSEGNHILTVKAALDYYEYSPKDLRHTESVENAYLIIDAIPDNTPTPAPTNTPLENSQISPSELVIPIIAAITIIAVSVSVYFLRIKR